MGWEGGRGGGITWKGKVERMNGMGWVDGACGGGMVLEIHKNGSIPRTLRAEEVCESRGGRPGLPVPNKPTVSVDVKQHSTTNADFRELS